MKANEGWSTTIRSMGSLTVAVLTYIRAFFVSRQRLALEAAALRQQLVVFKRKQPRPRLRRMDRLFWTTLRRLHSGWTDALIVVKPETVVSWHRAGFRLFWRWRSRQPGRPHGRRRILHFNCTEHPTANWILQQLREALPLPCPFRYVLFDRDAKFGDEVFAFLKASGIEPIRTSLRSPWQNGIAERWVGSIRRELTDHIIR